jgi:hypothetical protein
MVKTFVPAKSSIPDRTRIGLGRIKPAHIPVQPGKLLYPIPCCIQPDVDCLSEHHMSQSILGGGQSLFLVRCSGGDRSEGVTIYAVGRDKDHVCHAPCM